MKTYGFWARQSFVCHIYCYSNADKRTDNCPFDCSINYLLPILIFKILVQNDDRSTQFKINKGFFLNEEFTRQNHKEKFEEQAYRMSTFILSLLYASHLTFSILIFFSYLYKFYYGYKPALFSFIVLIICQTIATYAIDRIMRRKYPIEMFVKDLDTLNEEQKKPIRRFSTWVYVASMLICLGVEVPLTFF